MEDRVVQRRYPIGMQTFQEIREKNYVYVDKTEYLYNFLHGSGKYFFLSRPRRFGKSLLISTLQAYLEGKQKLFEGLALQKMETEWEACPVIRIDLSPIKTADVDNLQVQLDKVLRTQEQYFGRDPADVTPGSRLQGLIQHAFSQSGKTVAVLVDEYDAPLLNVIHKPEMLDRFREIMREFYAPIKACDAMLKFVFITGITKFSQLSIFSELNNLKNISMMKDYSAVCGITEHELATQLDIDLDAFSAKFGITKNESIALLKDHYDGYHFSEDSPNIFNPFSLMSALDAGELKPYWFASGTPAFLISFLEHQENWHIVDYEECEADSFEFDAPAENMTTALPVLYQGGYLTIKSYDAPNQTYILGLPNQEVRQGLSKNLVQHAAPEAYGNHNRFLNRMANYIRNKNIEEALNNLKSYLAGIPYDLSSKDEKGFETTFYLIFDLLGAKVNTEFKTATGRVDAVVRYEDAIYVFEFKYDKSAAAALEQIDSKQYLLPFKAEGLKLVKVGANFSSKTRTVDEWIIEAAE